MIIHGYITKMGAGISKDLRKENHYIMRNVEFTGESGVQMSLYLILRTEIRNQESVSVSESTSAGSILHAVHIT